MPGEVAMAWEATFDEAGAIVRVAVRGSTPSEEHLSARAAVARLLREHDSRRLLVDLRELETETVITTLGAFQFGASYSTEEGIPSGVRIAHLLPRDPKALRDVDFITAVATNRGAIIRNFDNEEQARAWLMAP
jgi:hypothetical protein